MSNSAQGDESPTKDSVSPPHSAASASHGGETLEKLWGEQLAVFHDVVITLRVDSESVAPESLGMKTFAAIPYQPGMFKATMSGADLLALASRAEVEEIVPDEEVTAL